MRQIEILDTTLRDGEQTSGVSFAAQEKLSIARLLLEELRVDRIEIASARVSEGEFEAVKRVCEWAGKRGHLNKVEILGFLDNGISIQWIKKAGGKVANLLCKGSLKHCTQQLRKSPEEHIEAIRKEISFAKTNGLQVNIYLEDWSNGMLSLSRIRFSTCKCSKKRTYRTYHASRHFRDIKPLLFIRLL